MPCVKLRRRRDQQHGHHGLQGVRQPGFAGLVAQQQTQAHRRRHQTDAEVEAHDDAELQQIDPFTYLVTLLRHAAAVALDPAAWMPWNYTATLAARASKEADPAPD